MTEVDPMQILPFEIQSILKRKSSRDPSSRFSSKLHLLLSYVNNHPDMEEKVGCAWVTDEEFRINKRVLVQVMGIKINTLNVNLHALGFNQQKHNKDGWTLWKRPGFTRNSADVGDVPQAQMPLLAKSKGFIVNFTLGKIDQSGIDNFVLICRKIWTEITAQTDDRPVQTKIFISKAAQRFKQAEQPIDNAREVLQAIISPPAMQQDAISFNQFCKFMAMFGPEETIMLKIASLLSCSNNSGQWLVFDPTVPAQLPNFYGSFEDKEPNCLILRYHSISKYTRIWNLPLASASQNYICDEYDKYYQSWEEYFQANPVIVNLQDYGMGGYA